MCKMHSMVCVDAHYVTLGRNDRLLLLWVCYYYKKWNKNLILTICSESVPESHYEQLISEYCIVAPRGNTVLASFELIKMYLPTDWFHDFALWVHLFEDILTYYWFINSEFMTNSSVSCVWTRRVKHLYSFCKVYHSFLVVGHNKITRAL